MEASSYDIEIQDLIIDEVQRGDITIDSDVDKYFSLIEKTNLDYIIKDYYKNFDTIIRRVLYRDLRLNSRYNTYRINGLPPGPISMPDISAIDAVLNYLKGDVASLIPLFEFVSKNNMIKWFTSKGMLKSTPMKLFKVSEMSQIPVPDTSWMSGGGVKRESFLDCI